MLTQFSLEPVDAGSDLLALGIMYSLQESHLITKAPPLCQNISCMLQRSRLNGHNRGVVGALFYLHNAVPPQKVHHFLHISWVHAASYRRQLRLSDESTMMYLCLTTPALSVP